MFVKGGGTKKRFLKQGEVLFRDGDAGDAAFIVDSGHVGICKIVEGEEDELATLNPGELFGEMAIVDGSKRMAHALAKEDSVVIEIPTAALEMRLKKVDPFLKALMNILVNNLRSVRQAYMKCARSINDYMNAIEFHTQGFRLYLTRLDESQMSTEGLEKLARIDVLVRDLRRSFKDHDDPRFSALREQDINHKK